MSIYKSKQRSPRTFSQWIRGLFGQRCKSFVTVGIDYEDEALNKATGKKLVCEKENGHRGRHCNGTWNWVYGDNWLDEDGKGETK